MQEISMDEKMKLETKKFLELVKEIVDGYPAVRAAYLFGSRAEGYEREGSDVDVAVFLDPQLSKQRTFALELELGDILERKLRRPVDILILNHVPLPLAFRVLKGTLIMERDPIERALFESRILSRYYDHQRFSRFHLKALYQRIKEGKFGT